MLNEVTKLCRNNFSQVCKKYIVYQIDYTAGESKLEIFDTLEEAYAFTEKYFDKSNAFTGYRIKEEFNN